MTPRMSDLDNSQSFYARLCEAFSGQDDERYIADEARILQKKKAVGKELELSLAAISLTTANMDIKVILMD